MDIVHNVTNWIDQNRYKALAIVLVASILMYGIGCQSKTASLVDPAKKVDRVEYAQEAAQVQADLTKEKALALAAIDAYNAQAEATEAKILAGMADLEHQEKIKAELFNLAGSVLTQATSGAGVSPASVIGTAITALGLIGGVGAIADAQRKDKIIASQKIELAKAMAVTVVSA